MTEHQVVWKVDVAIILGVIVGGAVILYVVRSLPKDDVAKKKEPITSEQ